MTAPLSIELATLDALINLTTASFDLTTAAVENNVGLSGEFNATSRCGRFDVHVSLQSTAPDEALSTLRAKCVLSCNLLFGDAHPRAGETMVSDVRDYTYQGEVPGTRLSELFHSGLLLRLLQASVLGHRFWLPLDEEGPQAPAALTAHGAAAGASEFVVQAPADVATPRITHSAGTSAVAV